MGKHDRARVERTGKVFRDGKYVPIEETKKTITETIQELSAADKILERVNKLKEK